MVSPREKDVETMPTQKTFKQRVRARMDKTGEAYTAARHQLLKKAADPAAPAGLEVDPAPDAAATDSPALLTSDESMRRGSGRGHEEWFALLDEWGAAGRRHPEIATWLRETHGVAGWWAQNITVSYERSRGMRGPGQMADGFSVSVSRTVGVPAERALEAFTDATLRSAWLPDAPLRSRPTRAALTARFDWSEPASRVVVAITPKSADRSTVAVAHERLADAATAAAFKAKWRSWLTELKAILEPS